MAVRVLAWLAAAWLLLVPWVVSAQGISERLEVLLRDQRAAEAYALATGELGDHEGDPRFDTLYGIAAIDSGHPGEGVFALERVLYSHPDDGRVRLALARGYFLLGDDRRAGVEFRALRRTDTPPEVVEMIDRYLAAIRQREARYRPSWRGRVTLAAGHDSNVNSATDDASFTSPLLGTLALAPESREAGDAFVELRAAARYRRPFRAGLAWFVSGGVDWRQLADEALFETRNLAASGGVELARGDHRVTLAANLQRFDLGDAHYRDLAGVTANWRRQLDQATRAGLFVQALRLDYPHQQVRDSALLLLGGNGERRLAGGWQPRLQGGLYVGFERARSSEANAEANAERDFYGVQAALLLQPSVVVTLHGTVLLQSSRYAANNPFLGVTRRDDFVRLGVGAARRLVADWWAGLDVRYTRNRSNSAIHDHERWELEASIRYEFD